MSRGRSPRWVGFGSLIISTGILVSQAGAQTMIGAGDVGGQTWTATGSPYVISGDITVRQGTTLTVEAGTQVQFLRDAQSAGVDRARPELTIDGSLVVNGTPENPATFARAPASTLDWYGIVIGPSATAATIQGAVIQGAQAGVITAMTGSTLTIKRVTIQSAGFYGIRIRAGTVIVDGVRIEGAMGIYLEPAANVAVMATIVNSVIRGGNWGITLAASGVVTATVTNCTIDRNDLGVVVSDAGAGSSLSIKNSILSNNSSGGAINQAGATAAASLTYSDVWNNGTSALGRVPPGTGCIASDPRFVDATNYRLVAPSGCIDSATSDGAPDHDADGALRPIDGDGTGGAGVDMGAYEFVPGASGAGGAGGTGGGAGGQAGAAGGRGGAGAGGQAGAGGGGSGGAAGALDGGSDGPPDGNLGDGSGSGGISGADGSAAGSAGGSVAGAGGGSATDGSPDTRPRSGGGQGCGCAIGKQRADGARLASIVLATLLLRRRKRRCRRRDLNS
jgi:hypothetical protein